MKRTVTFADITTSDYLANLQAGDVNGYQQDAFDLSDPYPKVTYVGNYSDGVHNFIRIKFYDIQWRIEYIATRLPTETVVVSDIQNDPPTPIVTGVTTTLTYSDSSTVTYVGTKQ